MGGKPRDTLAGGEVLKGLQLAELLHEPNNLGLTANLSAFGMRFREESQILCSFGEKKGGQDPGRSFPSSATAGTQKTAWKGFNTTVFAAKIKMVVQGAPCSSPKAPSGCPSGAVGARLLLGVRWRCPPGRFWEPLVPGNLPPLRPGSAAPPTLNYPWADYPDCGGDAPKKPSPGALLSLPPPLAPSRGAAASPRS